MNENLTLYQIIEARLGNPSLISWFLSIFSFILSIVYRMLYTKYRKIIADTDFIKTELVTTNQKIELLALKLGESFKLIDSKIDGIKLVIDYINKQKE
jgi:hypothetical protein